MLDQIEKYSRKLVADRSALLGGIAMAAKDDGIIAAGNDDLARLARDVLARLNDLALVAAPAALPFPDLLVRRESPEATALLPLDTETRTFLHDIPIIRREALSADPAPAIARLLGNRKGIVVEGIGIFAVGGVTVEQAYINWSSVFHSTYVKYLQDLLREGFRLPGEEDSFRRFREGLPPLTAEGLPFREGPLLDPDEIRAELRAVGGYTVARGLVDSFFGNISCRAGNTIYISQTAASLDHLEGCIDPVPMDNSSTAGITASSELLAHRRIYETADAAVILHGHPRFAVIMSMLCTEQGCGVTDCWKDCPTVRYVGDTPVVAGEIGAGGLAKRVPPVIAGTGKAIVYGHGLFTTGRTGFREAFERMVQVENDCRREYFARISSRRRNF